MSLCQKFFLFFLHLKHFGLLDFLLLKHFLSSLEKPLWISNYLISSNFLSDTAMVGIIFSLLKLLLIHLLIQPMHLSHFFDFIKINNKASFISMVFFNAFSAKHCQMIRTVKVLYPLIMLITQQAVNHIFIFKINVS